MADQRPTPEEALRRVQEEESLEGKGKLKILLGAAPGVGKTYAMLEEAQERQKEGIDVVVGYVETHGRKETEALLTPLEVIPRTQLNYRGKTLEEFDLEATLKRNPDLILVDEMAHTNMPGVRHAKRWQDIKELIDRGIDVYTTMNIQHLESLNDIIAQITGFKVMETVPDSILEMADSIELIDLPPNDLLQRLREGKVYFPAQAEIAAENYFKKGNLIALRELALRITAECVDIEVLIHRHNEAIKKLWPIANRLLVCVNPSLGSAKLVRTTKRLASSLKAEWIALFVDTPRLTEKNRANAATNLHLAETLGAETRIIEGQDLIKEILNLARELNVDKIIVGKQIQPKWKYFLFGDLTSKLIEQSEEIDIYVVTDMASAEKQRGIRYTPVAKPGIPWLSYGLAVIVVTICTLVNYLLYDLLFKGNLNSGNLIMIYLLGVMAIAIRGERGPSILVSILSVASFAFFFIPPHYSFVITDIQYLITLLVMLFISQEIGHLSILTKSQAEIARSHERRTKALYYLSRQLARILDINELLQTSTRYISEIFDAQTLALLPDINGHLIVIAGYPLEFTLNSKEQSIAQWVYDLGQVAGLGTQTLSNSNTMYLPLLGSKGPVGVISVQPKDSNQMLAPEQIHLLEALTHQIALVVEVRMPHEIV